MSDEFKRSIKNITGISSHVTFVRGIASDINFDFRAETVIIHSTCEQLYVMVRDTCVNVLRGEFILIDPFTPYSIISNPEKDPQTYELLMFRATTDQWSKSSCFFFSNGSLILKQSEARYTSFASLFGRIAGIVTGFPKEGERLPYSELLVLHGCAELLCADMISEFGWHEIPSPVFESWDIFENTFAFVCENLNSDISLDEISARSGLSTFYFSHKYKEIFGNTVMRDVTKLKLYKSVAMLIQSNASISDVAIGCGFGSVATYCSIFKKYYTFTPLAMRRKKSILTNHNGG